MTETNKAAQPAAAGATASSNGGGQAEELLKVTNLKMYFPITSGLLFQRKVADVKAVDGISFTVRRGETLGLVGESGCGKSTTARAILQLYRPTAGSVLFEGNELTKLKGGELRRMRRRMQMIFQDPYGSMNPRMTIEAALTEPMVIQGIGHSSRERRDRAAALLEEVGLEAAHLRRYPHEFSGGQRQRICIARALAVEPEFLICDESVSALDVSVQAQVLNLLKRLQEKHHLTYIFISHDLSVVKFMADMIAVMKDGRIVEFGPSDTIYAHPRTEYTRQLIAAVPKDDLEHIRQRQAARLAARAQRLSA
ncbi:MAG: ATP-binding cassette domain-containing protein [Chloroflexi bacterium]|nr:ATP-binding cassette domain-containing protein [Chloroflexota bacterium]